MEIALYHEEWGYYAQPDAGMIGRKGDFYTSVSVGETFGLLLAYRIRSEWEKHFDRSRPLVVVEQGGHDGQLARDIMAGWREIAGNSGRTLDYRLVEPRKPLRESLRESLKAVPEGEFIQVVESLEEARAPEGIFLCNELLDAFPVERLIFESGQWRAQEVGFDAEGRGFAWVSRPLSGPLAELVFELGEEYPEGYVSEACPVVDEWMRDAGRLFERGLWWVIDYGFDRKNYYLPERTSGTLRCYEGHRAGDNPFLSPGRQDITAHVDFTRLERAALREGLQRRTFTDQHHFLIDAARPWLLGMEGRAADSHTSKRLRQFQTLTHPSLMGMQFKVMELARGI